MSKPTVFISSTAEGLPIAEEFARQLAATTEPALWSESIFLPGKTITESLTEVADRADFAVFVLTSEDALGIRGDTGRAPRPSIVFEMGFLAGRIGIRRIMIVTAGRKGIDLPTDLAGVLYVSIADQPTRDLEVSVAPGAAAVSRAIAELGPRAERRLDELASCFISYSWTDKEFAAQLHEDLRAVGVRCWLDAKDLSVGARLSEHINRAIQAHDKMLLVLSQASIHSPWVQIEMAKALDLEGARNATVLFPIRVDDAVLEAELTPAFAKIRDRLILDFTAWHDRARYRKAFSRLVRDLTISASVESERRR